MGGVPEINKVAVRGWEKRDGREEEHIIGQMIRLLGAFFSLHDVDVRTLF